MTAVLEVQGVSKRFGGLDALTDVSMVLEAGRITGIIGPNGAGKSTLVNVITGLYKATSGRIILCGNDVSRVAVHRRAKAGLVRSFQHPHLFAGMTASEMLRTARLSPRGRRSGGPDSRDALRSFGLGDVADKLVDDLPYGVKKLLNVIAVWSLSPQVLLLDEPFAGVGDQEAALFAESIKLMRSGEMAIGLIEHNVDVVLAAAEHLIVLDSGTVIFDGSPSEGIKDRGVIEAYFGAGASRFGVNV